MFYSARTLRKAVRQRPVRLTCAPSIPSHSSMSWLRTSERLNSWTWCWPRAALSALSRSLTLWATVIAGTSTMEVWLISCAGWALLLLLWRAFIERKIASGPQVRCIGRNSSPWLWNDLPPGLRWPGLSFDSFRRSLKTHLFGNWSA